MLANTQDGDGITDDVDDDLNGNNVPDWQEDHDCDGVPDIIGESVLLVKQCTVPQAGT